MDKQTTQPVPTGKPAPANHYTPEASAEFKAVLDHLFEREKVDASAGYHRTTW